MTLADERYRILFEEAPLAYFSVGRDGRIHMANPRAAELLGYSLDELVGRTVFDLYADTAEGKAKARRLFERFVAGEEIRGEELEMRGAGGRVIWVSLTARSVRDSQGEVKESRSVVVDITARKLAELALQAAHTELEQSVRERTAQLSEANLILREEIAHRQRAEAALRASEQQHRVLLEINNAIVANLEREPLFQAMAGALQNAVDFDRASLTLYDPEKDLVRVFALADTSPAGPSVAVGTEFPRQGSVWEHVIADRRPRIRRDLKNDSLLTPEDQLLQMGIRSGIVVPLVVKGTAIGSLNIGSRTPGRYSERDVDYLAELATQVALAVENMLAYEEIAKLKARLEEENIYLQEEIQVQQGFGEIVGESPAIKRVLKAIETVASTDATVLLTGETGTGKELVARAVHVLSARREKTLVKVNCAALPAGLIESELFGHEKGAFTGALSRKTGRFELAHGGTIFLDEIGDLPLELQAKLLRVLQGGELERVGGTQTIRVDVRVIAATNRDLEKLTEEGRFRADLYYRVNVFPIRVPPLRERREDIPLLARHFVMKYALKLGKRLTRMPQERLAALSAYPWPGNVRELENVIERAVILSPGERLELGEWPPKAGLRPQGGPPVTLREVEREHILSALEASGWRVSGERGTAKLLGLKPSTLQARMKKLGIIRKR